MATLHSGYTPQSSLPRQNFDPVELDNIHDSREQSANNTTTHSSVDDVKTTLDAAKATNTSTPRRAPSHNSNTELDTVNSQHDEFSAAGLSLPPVDTGKDAWLFLFAAFVMEFMVWGFPFAYGIFQDYYTTHPPFEGQGNIALVGTCAMGIMYLSSPLVFSLLAWFPTWKRPLIIIGLVISCLSLGLSSLSMTVPHLIVSQGVCYAIGGGLCYSPTVSYVDEWFEKRKGFAFGIMWAGTGLGGVVIPLLLQFLLDKYGFRTTLRIWTVVFFASSAPLYIFLKPRLPISSATNRRAFNFSFLKNKTYIMLQLGNVLEGFGYFVPSIYLPSIARGLGASSSVSALTLILLNIATVPGCVCMGWIVDRWHITICLLITTVGATLSTFLLWGFTTNLALLLVFSFIYGFFAGCFTTTYPGMMKAVTKNQPSYDPIMVYASLVAGRGIGNVACGPISEALMKTGAIGTIGVYGTEYASLVIFTGVSAALGGVSCFGRTLGWF